MPLHLWLTLAGVVVALTVVGIVSLVMTANALRRFERQAEREFDRAFPDSGMIPHSRPLLADSDFLGTGD